MSARLQAVRPGILITGSPRSGTTFVGRMLALPRSIGYLDEPFNVQIGMTWVPRQFVVAAPAEVEEVLNLAETYSISRARIWLMAEGTDSATLAAREQWLAQLCLEHNLTLSKRLHIELYGDTRGT